MENRVLVRRGAKELSLQELERVSGGTSDTFCRTRTYQPVPWGGPGFPETLADDCSTAC